MEGHRESRKRTSSNNKGWELARYGVSDYTYGEKIGIDKISR